MDTQTNWVETSTLDPILFRSTMGTFATGVAVILSYHNDRVYGMTANSLTSVSLNPCLLLVCPKIGSTTGIAMKESGAFVVNILDETQQELATRFVGDFTDRFNGIDLKIETKFPVLPGALAHLDCHVRNVYDGGDHDIIVGEVVSCSHRPGSPLVFFRGKFGKYVAGQLAA